MQYYSKVILHIALKLHLKFEFTNTRMVIHIPLCADKLHRIVTRNSSGDEIAKRDFSIYLFILQLYVISSSCNK